jgi:hypothetical protein
MSYYIVTDSDNHYWTGGTFFHDFLRALPVTQDEVDTLRRWFPERKLTAMKIKWTEYVAAFVRTVRDEGEESVYYYLLLKCPGYMTQSFSMSVWADCNGRKSVRCRYGATLNEIKRLAKVFDEMQAVIERGLAARKSKAA